MKHSKILSLMLSILLVLSFVPMNFAYADADPYIKIELDKTKADLGEIITATIKVNDITNFGGYQVNIKYDPAKLQAIDLKNNKPFDTDSLPANGTILANEEFGILRVPANDIDSGIINFGGTYSYVSDYRETGLPEETGIIGEIGFKVLVEEGNTAIHFEDTPTIPMGVSGTDMFDWFSKRIKGYQVINPGEITIGGSPAIETPKPSTAAVSMELNGTLFNVGETIEATIDAYGMENLSAYHINIKYDPEILQAINVVTGEPFKANTLPDGGTLLINEEYGATAVAANEIENGIINFGRFYTFAQDYRSDGVGESSGEIGTIGFRALKPGETTIRFEKTDTMPEGKEGTMFFDWDARKIRITKSYSQRPLL